MTGSGAAKAMPLYPTPLNRHEPLRHSLLEACLHAGCREILGYFALECDPPSGFVTRGMKLCVKRTWWAGFRIQPRGRAADRRHCGKKPPPQISTRNARPMSFVRTYGRASQITAPAPDLLDSTSITVRMRWRCGSCTWSWGNERSISSAHSSVASTGPRPRPSYHIIGISPSQWAPAAQP